MPEKTLENDEFWMRQAIEAAQRAEALDEVPIGACLIGQDGELLAIAGNRTRIDCDPTAHAEIVILRQAAKKIGNYRLTETTLLYDDRTLRNVRGRTHTGRESPDWFSAHTTNASAQSKRILEFATTVL